MKRRHFLTGATALAAIGAAGIVLRPSLPPAAALAADRAPLRMPTLIDTTETGRFEVVAQTGQTDFGGGLSAQTIGFNQSYLGPVVRMKKGPLEARVGNTLPIPVSAHWHGLLVPGEHDGGPHLPVEPGGEWVPDMEIDQSPCTAFFHTHIHGRTARDVYAGLAGAIHVTDGLDDERGLPSTYGVDDLTLLLQDRRFTQDGELAYASSMMDIMHGMTGDTMLINGQLDPVAVVPKSIVRLRLINASNARIYSLFCDDGRPMHLVATDGGYLPVPVALETLRLSPGERAEILVDFSDGRAMTLASDGDPNSGMGGMMGRALGMVDRVTGLRQFPVLPFTVDERLEGSIKRLPDNLGGARPDHDPAKVAATRRFSLDMGMGGGRGMGGMGGMGGGMMGGFSINGRPFEMGVINEEVERGATERWIVTTNMLTHPFHVHGVSFQVVGVNGREPGPEDQGWKDTVLVDGETELLVRFDHPASRDTPFMYHCHILEHEDAGMMGQFTVS